MNKFQEKAQDYFDRHPSSEECYITSDGRVFHNIGSAQSMAGTLDDQKIESYKRSVIEKDKALKKDLSESNLPDQLKNSTEEIILMAEETRSEKIKELEALELVKTNYNEMKSLAKFFGLNPDDQKAETLIAALEEFKTTLKK